MLRVCQIVASINRDTGGPAVSVTSLGSALANNGIESHLATLDYPGVGPMLNAPGVNIHSLAATWLARNLRGWSPGLKNILKQLAAGGMDVLHSHGVWMFPNAYAREVALSEGIPLVISPRGMLDAWSMRRSQLKKRVVWMAMEHSNLRAARLFHVTSKEEGESLRDLGFQQPMAIIPNGVGVPGSTAGSSREELISRFPPLRDRRWLLFMSRLHPKKGIGELLRAWHEIAAEFPDWHLIVAGPDLDGYGAQMKRETNALDLDRRVTFTGMIEGATKSGILSNAELFVLPTHSENFGLVIAEAFAHGVPVITTKAAPWSKIQAYNCGWWIDDNHRELTTALRAALCQSRIELSVMGMRGKAFVSSNYSWAGIGTQMSQVYGWLLGRETKPHCVT
jgi:glycosyltransferase involved in cell wall biosynthesis